MRPQLVRKCECCKAEIPINLQTIGELVFFDKKYYHKDCFANLCKENSSPSSRKKNKEKWSYALKNIKELRMKTIEHLKPIIVEDAVYRLMMEYYQPTVISGFVWKKLDQIYNGTYKDMSRRIPPKHLIDMWKRKIGELKSIHKKMELDGKELDPNGQIMYDLAVLVNKYDSYLKWLEKQRIIEVEKDSANADNATITQIADKNAIKNAERANNDNDDTDILALVDEIFD